MSFTYYSVLVSWLDFASLLPNHCHIYLSSSQPFSLSSQCTIYSAVPRPDFLLASPRSSLFSFLLCFRILIVLPPTSASLPSFFSLLFVLIHTLVLLAILHLLSRRRSAKCLKKQKKMKSLLHLAFLNRFLCFFINWSILSMEIKQLLLAACSTSFFS